MIRIALRSARRLFRDAIVDCLDARPDFTVVGNVAELYELPVLCELCRPDVVVIDVGTEFGADRQSLYRLRTSGTSGKLVVVYEQLSPIELAALLTLGVDTLMPYTVSLDGLVAVVRQHGFVYRDLSAPPGAANGLTEQERQIVTLLSAGHTVSQIAHLLDVSASAVANAKRRIYRKLDVVSQSQVSARAAALGIFGRHSAALLDAVRASSPAPRGGLPVLTSRERDILQSIANGHTVRLTARGLGIAEKTVENIQSRLFRKLGAHNRSGALAAAHALGLLEPVSSS